MEAAAKEVITDLEGMANPAYIAQMEYFGIKAGTKALGIKNEVLKRYAKSIGRSQELANELWNCDYHEAKLLALHIAEPKKFTEALAEKWTSECYSWDLVDGVGLKIMPNTPFALQKIAEWTLRQPEFEKRMGFATMVGVTIHNKKIEDEILATFFPILEREAWDDRNFVKKAVNWALRQLGKRNLALNEQAIAVAERIKTQDFKSARWIASDALRELNSPAVMGRLARKQR